MAVITIPRALSDKLGEEATDALVDVISKIEPDNGKIKAELTKELVTKDIFEERTNSLEKNFNERMNSLEKNFNERMNSLEKHFNERTNFLEKNFNERTNSLENKMNSFITKAEFTEELGKTNERITRVEGELKLMRWMMGIIIAGVVSLIMKAFFM